MVTVDNTITAAKNSAEAVGSPSLTWATARWLKRQALATGSPEAQDVIALCVMDFLSNCVGALNTSAGRNIARFAGRPGGRAEAILFGTIDDIGAAEAAFGNAALGHLLIRDDIDTPSGSHFGVVVIPALIAFAQREQFSGKQLLAWFRKRCFWVTQASGIIPLFKA